jgi:peptidoglycan biosynthesis protein MviN/MurJ (putative lipid II flippase)
MLVNVALNWLLALHSPLPPLGLAPAGLALANTVAAFVNYFVMARFLNRMLDRPLGGRPRIGETFWKSLAAAALACACGYGLYRAAVRWGVAPHDTLTRAATLLPAIALVAVLHFALVRLLRAPDSERVTEKILHKLRRS